MNIVWGVLIVLAADAIAVGAMLFVRRRAPEGSYFTDGDRASGVFGVLATGFSIFAGFVIFLAFTTYDQSRSGSEAEALTLAQQFETAQFFPTPVRGRLTGELICYGRSVVHQEWPLMEQGGAGGTLNPWAGRLFASLQLTKPTTPTQQSAYDKWLDQTSDRESARNDRVHGAAGIIPVSLWIVLLLTAAVVFLYMLFFADSAEPARSQAMLVASATTVVVVTLLAISSLNDPYGRGVGSIRPTAMQRALGLIDRARVVVHDRSAPPCDANGAPAR